MDTMDKIVKPEKIAKIDSMKRIENNAEKDHPVKFKQNLQILRKRAGFSQEELAEKMDVSRQSVSKWESGEAYPEMKMLLALCDLFHVSLDELVHGDVEIKESAPLRQKYEKLVGRHATLAPIGVGLILVGVAILLALQGFANLDNTEFEPLTIAPLLALTAIAVVLFVITGNEMDDFKRRYRSLPNLYTEDELETLMPKNSLFHRFRYRRGDFGRSCFDDSARSRSERGC